MKRIAQAAGCNPNYLSQCKDFTRARKTIREVGRRQLLRGEKSKDGDVEAQYDKREWHTDET